MTFSGGSYEEVARWLHNFLTAHAKREHPRFEVELEAEGEREGKSYGARLGFGEHRSALMELDFKDVADHRGALAWCTALAEKTRARAREVMAQAAQLGARGR
ncbi:MAG: hypothetical protein ACREM3_23725 [Candidatus Rokuibacteriota bacterium]